MQQHFVEAKIATKFGSFNFRVYQNDLGKETVVLWTPDLNRETAVLVRVHSECMTGDVFCSLNCDCGKQLDKSLQLINKEGGVFIYLRQEGRGIGLFEKIKAYQLQLEGHDTFEANVLLGHQPDQRTYEMVKTALTDLSVQHIRLLTNNPSKVSEIAKFGIEVAERVPLIVKSNKHNLKYLDTKKDKFKHFFNKNSYYFYQFHAESSDQVDRIAEFIKDKRKDPLLKICVGIEANDLTLTDKNKIAQIESIFKACNLHEGFIPVLHFSFRNSTDILQDLKKIKELLPFVKRVQLNDLPVIDSKYISQASEFFSVDLPLSDDNFEMIHDEKLRNIIKESKMFILLDNSKGRGIKEVESSFKRKIDKLLHYGLNDIAVCGGFGPDELDTYFSLRRYYRFNLSIDAESKLKTNGRVDLEKTMLYLYQLTRFDDPDKQGIEQTRKILEKQRSSSSEMIIIQNAEFLIHPKVFHPRYFPSTTWYAEKVSELAKSMNSFCEVGCGSGVVSCLVAMANPRIHVVATDISSYASENTKINVNRLYLNTKVDVVQGDVLDAIKEGTLFDAIFWSLPFGFLDPGTEVDIEETQVFDPGYRGIRKFFKNAKKFLNPHGQLLIGFSSDLGHFELLKEIASEFKVRLELKDEKILTEKKEIKFELFVGTYLKS